jgi:hypothetical protein
MGMEMRENGSRERCFFLVAERPAKSKKAPSTLVASSEASRIPTNNYL